jgi:hypothetical protein
MMSFFIPSFLYYLQLQSHHMCDLTICIDSIQTWPGPIMLTEAL